MRPSFLLCLAFFALATRFSAVAGEEKHLYVASLAYDVAIAPVDEESKNAEEAVLYARRNRGDAWERLGECKKTTLPNGDVRFTREVDVDRDGVYEYTSRPVVGGEVDNPPRPEDPAQAIVVVDTLAPTAEILLPPEDYEVKPGEPVKLSWTVSDENLGDKPAVFTYSTDGGRSWNLVERGLPAEGVTHWTAPADMAGPAIVRLAAIDLAGNVGRAVRRVDTAEAEVAKAPETPPAKITTTLDETPAKTEPVEEPARLRDPNRSWLYYLMAVNLMRQNKPAEALHYYWLSVKEDPEFVNAWADIALAYIDLGAFRTAREVTEQTRELAPGRIDLIHLMGETFHAEGMAALGSAQTTEERMRAKGLIDQAVMWYGKALDTAAKEWRLAEQAASFYRLGEVCYYVNMDREGARAYWKKILSLHTPAPNPDLVLWSPKNERDKEKKRQEKFTHQRVSLETWQKWARGYIEQMDARERAGILDLMPAQRVAAFGAGTGTGRAQSSLSYSGNAMNPGRDDGRSLFSLPTDLGSADDIAACAGVAGQPSGYNGYDHEQAAMAAHMNRRPLTDDYSFYARDSRDEDATQPRRQRPAGRRNRSAFSPMREPEPQQPVDPYAFPRGQRPHAPWNSTLPYGDKPPGSW